jgi:sugar/nucleoside kinase (ribokinase family)
MSIDLYGIGNALVDSEYKVSEAILSQTGFVKGTMTLVDAAERQQLITLLEDTSKITLSKRAGGGSAANTVVTTALLGGSTFYSCKVSNDKTGDFFARDLIDLSVATNLAEARPAGVTGECISMITPDGERTLVTHLGITQTLSIAEIDATVLASAQFLYIEGYLVTSPSALEAALKTQAIAKQHGVKVALTLSDVGMVENFKTEFNTLFENGIDLVFCNEDEAKLWTGCSDRNQAAQTLGEYAASFAMTLSGDGAIVSGSTGEPVFVPAEMAQALDTTGAGDTFAGGVLYGLTRGATLEDATAQAHLLAKRVVSRFGARLDHQEVLEITAPK